MSLIDQIEEFITDPKYDKLKSYTIELNGSHLSKSEHIFDFLLRTGEVLNSWNHDIYKFLYLSLFI